MPIYKADGKKGGLQKYLVRVNFIDNGGKARQLTRTAYGLEQAKDLERKLEAEQKGKGDAPTKKMTLQQLFDEYINVKRYKVRETTLERNCHVFENNILPTFKDVRIDRLNTALLQEWKQSIEERLTPQQTKLELSSKRHIYDTFNAMLNYAVKMEHLPKNPLSNLGTFVDVSTVKQEMQYYTASEFRQYISMVEQIAAEKEATQNDLSEWDYYVF